MIYKGVDLVHGAYYWLMSGEGITIGKFADWQNGRFIIIGDDAMYPVDCFPIIEEVCLEHTVKFPTLGKNKE